MWFLEQHQLMMKMRQILLCLPLFSYSTQIKTSFWALHARENCEGLKSEICVLRVADTVEANLDVKLFLYDNSSQIHVLNLNKRDKTV